MKKLDELWDPRGGLREAGDPDAGPRTSRFGRRCPGTASSPVCLGSDIHPWQCRQLPPWHEHRDRAGRTAHPARREASRRPPYSLAEEIPLGAALGRAVGAEMTPHASLSRGRAGIAKGTVGVNLPGYASGTKNGLDAFDPILEHPLAQGDGEVHHG